MLIFSANKEAEDVKLFVIGSREVTSQDPEDDSALRHTTLVTTQFNFIYDSAYHFVHFLIGSVYTPEILQNLDLLR